MPLFGRKRITIKDVDVKLDGWQYSGQSDSVIQYAHANGDVFSVNFFDKPPDIGASLSDVTGIRSFYRNMLIPNKMGLLECDVHAIDGTPSVYMLAKLMMEPRGFVFLASQTIPRRDCSSVLKYQAVESGMTGIRESAVMAMLPTPKIDEKTNKIIGWCTDPYDASLEYEVMCNQADSREYDNQFPDHPLSRTRKFMDELPNVVTMSDRFRKCPAFEL